MRQGLAIGLALQGSLGNFAGGVLLLIFRPIKVGDLVEAQGNTGVIQAISIFTTTMLTPDNRTVIIPNGPLSNGNIINHSAAGKIRVDLVVGIAYGADIKLAKEVALQTMLKDDKVLKDPAPEVTVLQFRRQCSGIGRTPLLHHRQLLGCLFWNTGKCESRF